MSTFLEAVQSEIAHEKEVYPEILHEYGCTRSNRNIYTRGLESNVW